jgi:hypothetical protein
MNPVRIFTPYFNIFPRLPNDLHLYTFGPQFCMLSSSLTCSQRSNMIHGASYNSKNIMAISVTISLLFFFLILLFLLFSLQRRIHFRTPGEGNKRISKWILQIISKKLTTIFKWKPSRISPRKATNSMLLKLRSSCYLTQHKNSNWVCPCSNVNY